MNVYTRIVSLRLEDGMVKVRSVADGGGHEVTLNVGLDEGMRLTIGQILAYERAPKRLEVSNTGEYMLVVDNGVALRMYQVATMAEVTEFAPIAEDAFERYGFGMSQQSGPPPWTCNGQDITMQTADGKRHTWTCLT